MIRFFATNTEEMQEVSDYLTQIFDNRKILSENGNSTERINDYAFCYCSMLANFSSFSFCEPRRVTFL